MLSAAESSSGTDTSSGSESESSSSSDEDEAKVSKPVAPPSVKRTPEVMQTITSPTAISKEQVKPAQTIPNIKSPSKTVTVCRLWFFILIRFLQTVSFRISRKSELNVFLCLKRNFAFNS